MIDEPEQCPWRAREVVYAFLGLPFFMLVVSVVLNSLLTLKAYLYASVAMFGVYMAGVPVFIVTRRRRLPVSSLGFRAGRYPVFLSVSLAAVAAFLLETAVYASPLAQPSPLLQGVWQSWEKSRVMLFFALLIRAPGFSSVFIAPLAEEIFYRGFMLPCFNVKWGWLKGLPLHAMVFSLAHTDYLSGDAIYYLSFRFVLGLLLGALYIKTGSLYPCIAAHVAYNFGAVFYTAFYWKGI